MTLEEAIAEFEKSYAVHDRPGFVTEDDDGVTRADMNKAPSGDSYVTLTSGGIRKEDGPHLAWFLDEERAAEEWLRQAWTYAEDHPGRPHLHWRRRPVFLQAEFIALDQIALMNDARLRQSITLNLGTVDCRMVLSKTEG